MKYFLITKKHLLWSSVIWALFVFFPNSAFCALARSSALEMIENSLPAIVSISAENAQLLKSPNAAAKDPQTGRTIIFKKLRAAHYNRTGSGVIIDPTGIIVTNAHIINQARRITVTLNDTTHYEATVLLVVKGDDCAFLRINHAGLLSALSFADSESPQIGTVVYTVGSSEIIDGTFAQGKVTGVGQATDNKQKGNKKVDIIQTNFSVYKGDSGGPLLDSDGKLLGLIVAGRTRMPHTSFAIPAHKIKQYYAEYLKSATNP